ncbi:hypothetical protein [Microcystis phage Mwe-JY31]
MSKKNTALEALQKFKNSTPNTTPLQEVKPQEDKKKRTEQITRFTVDIESELMDKIKILGVQKKKKIRHIFEEALTQYLKDQG